MWQSKTKIKNIRWLENKWSIFILAYFGLIIPLTLALSSLILPMFPEVALYFTPFTPRIELKIRRANL
jgi:hypothetical protein